MATADDPAAEALEAVTHCCPLLELPAEISNNIYELALSHITDQTQVSITYHKDPDSGYRQLTASVKTYHPLVITCRRTRAELASMLANIDPTRAGTLVWNIKNFHNSVPFRVVDDLIAGLPFLPSERLLARHVVVDKNFDLDEASDDLARHEGPKEYFDSDPYDSDSDDDVWNRPRGSQIPIVDITTVAHLDSTANQGLVQKIEGYMYDRSSARCGASIAGCTTCFAMPCRMNTGACTRRTTS